MMINNFFGKKIIKIFGLIILVIGIIITSIIIKNPQIFDTKASLDDDPINIQITNISDSQFTISYTTNNKTIGTIMLGTDPNNLDILVLDDRDQLIQQVNSYKAHHISPKDLDPETTYYFLVNSGKKTFLNKNKPFSVTTGPEVLSAPPIQQPLSGDVKLPSGQNAEEGIIYLDTNGSQKISTIVSNGKYILPLNNLLTENLLSYFILNNNSILNIEAFSENLTSKTSFKYNQSNPIRAIVLNNTVPQGGIETPSPSTENPENINTTISSPQKPTDKITPNTTDSSKINTEEKKSISSQNQNKNNASDQKLSGIIFGLGAFIIVGSGVILLFITRRKK